MSCRAHTYLCSDPVLNEIPKRRAQGRPRLPLAGQLVCSAHARESVGFQVWTPDRTMIPGIPGRMRTWASGRRHPTKGRVPLGTHTFPVRHSTMTAATVHGSRPVPELMLACRVVHY